MKQSILLNNKTLSFLALGVSFNILAANNAMASSFSSEPIYNNVINYEAQISTTNGLGGFDFTDIYYPEVSNPNQTFPIALMLQGALVDKSDYSSFASQIASYGFLVAVPNHLRSLSSAFPPGLFPTQELVTDVLTFMGEENIDRASPLEGKIDLDRMGLLGHSFGGSVGLGAVQGNCFPAICNTEFNQPEALKAGIFYGARFGDQDPSSPAPPIFNNGIPTGLIGGDLDGVISLSKVLETYEQIQNPPKVAITVNGANHYGITNNDNFRDAIPPTLDQEIATETIARWSGLFLRAHILEDRQAFNYVYSFGDAQDENVTVISRNIPEYSSNWNIILLGTGIIIHSIIRRSLNKN